jgi:hypothetical protein
MVGGYAPQEIRLIGTMSDDIDGVEYGLKVADWSAVWPRGVPLGRTFLLRGRPGAGKSRLAYRLAAQLGRAMVFGIEMGKTLSLDTARQAGAQCEQLVWYDDLEGLAELELLEPAVVVIDSIQKLRRARRQTVDRLMAWAKQSDSSLVLVSQLSADGKSRYGEDDDFDCDMTVDVWPGRTTKGPRKDVHLFEDTHRRCDDGCAHVLVAKSRVCPLVAFDAPIVAGY